MTRRAFFVQLLLFAAIVAVLNIAIASLTVNSVPRQVLRAIGSSPPVDTLLVGNSLVAAGVDATTYQRVAGPTLNIAMGSSSPIEHDLLLRRALALRPKRVLYGFFDGQLTQPPGVSWSDLFGNRAAAFYIEPDVAARFIASGSTWRRLQYHLLGHVPMFVERAAIWAKVEGWRRRLHGIGVPPQPTGQFGRIADFAGIEPLTPEEFRRYCAHVVAERAPLTIPVVDMFVEARRHGADMTVVEMPQVMGHRERYYATPEWNAYRQYLAQEVRRLGGTYVSASDWMPDAAFEDGVHLSPAGARAFSARLAAAQ